MRGVIFRDGKIFGVKLTGYRNGVPADFWSTPGGGTNESEPLEAALSREMIEETGITPVIGSLLYVQQYSDKDNEQLEFFFHIKNADDYDNIDLATTAHGVEEIAQHGFIDPKKEIILPKLLAEVNIAQDIEQNHPTKLFNYL